MPTPHLFVPRLEPITDSCGVKGTYFDVIPASLRNGEVAGECSSAGRRVDGRPVNHFRVGAVLQDARLYAAPVHIRIGPADGHAL